MNTKKNGERLCRVCTWLVWSLLSLRPVHSEEVKVALHPQADRLQIHFLLQKPAEVQYEVQGREILLRLPGAGEIPDLDKLPSIAGNWLESISSGYDTILLRAAKAVEFSTNASGAEFVVCLTSAPQTSASESKDGLKAEMRLLLLEARLDSDAGHLKKAADSLNSLSSKFPYETEILTGQANLESQAGRWRRASTLYNQALMTSPENEELMEAKARLLKDQGSQASADFIRKTTVDAWEEQLLRAAGRFRIGDAMRVGFVYDQDYVQTEAVRLADGSVGTFDGFRRRAEASLEHSFEGGTQIAASLLMDEQSRGLGVTVSRPDYRGQLRLSIEYRRPFWEFVEGLVAGGVRDRIEAYREQRLTSRLNGWLAGAFNRYGLECNYRAATSLGVSGGLNLLLTRKPILSLQYGFDGEYRRSIQSRIDAAGIPYFPLPLISREVHAVDIAVNHNLTRSIRAEGFGGIAIDRLGGSGPYLGARVVANLSKSFEAQLEFDRRLNSVNTGRVVNRLTCRAIWKMQP